MDLRRRGGQPLAYRRRDRCVHRDHRAARIFRGRVLRSGRRPRRTSVRLRARGRLGPRVVLRRRPDHPRAKQGPRDRSRPREGPARRRRGPRPRTRYPDAEPLRHRGFGAERVRHRARPASRVGRRHARPPGQDGSHRARGRDRTRALARGKPRHPRDAPRHDPCRHGRAPRRLDVAVFLLDARRAPRARRWRQRDHRRDRDRPRAAHPDHRHAHSACGLAPARVPRRRLGCAPHTLPVWPRVGVAQDRRGPRAARSREQGDRVAVHRQSAEGRARLLRPPFRHASADRGAHPQARGDGMGRILTIDDRAKTIRADDVGFNDFYGVSLLPDGALAVGSRGTVQRQTSAGWQPYAQGLEDDLFAVVGFSGSSAWTIGSGGASYRLEAAGWRPFPTGVTTPLRALTGPSATDVLAVGDGRTIIRFRGRWQTLVSGVDTALLAAVRAGTTTYVAGEGGVALSIEGSQVKRIDLGTTCAIRGAFVHGNEVWFVGSEGTHAGVWRRVSERVDRWGTC